MPWDSVPWFVEGAAEHSSEVTRLLAYAAFGGADGIVGANDLRVQALSSPAAAVRVTGGACAITNRAPGASYQSYAARLPTPDQVSVAATGVSARSDLVVARIESPYTESWPLPADPKVGPYVFTRIVSGVPKTTTDIAQIRPGDSAITLARVDLPPNTSSVTAGMITDLREMVQARRERRLYPCLPTQAEALTAQNGAWYDWPTAARVTVKVPKWATRAQIITTITGLGLTGDYVYGSMQHVLGTTWGGRETPIDDDQGSGNRRTTLAVATVMDIPLAMRGTTQPLFLRTYMGTFHTGDLSVDRWTAIVHDVEWQEAPALDGGV